jgi:hypothetical protein
MRELEPTVAMDVLLLVQVPPPASLKVLVRPTQTLKVPEMAEGAGLTVIAVVARQPVPNVYVIVKDPAATPDTMPDDEPTVARVVVLLAHVPPPASLRVAVALTHTVAGPDMDAGSGLTVTTTVVRQPVANV